MATLTQLSELFQMITGRYDLVSTSSTVYNYKTVIWEATKYLDRSYETPDSFRTYKKDIASGDYCLDTVNYIRSVKNVWVMSSADNRSEVFRRSLNWLKREYPEPTSEIDQGTPLYYCPCIIGLSPQQEALTSSDYTDEFTYDYEWPVRFADDYDARGVVFMPVSDDTYTITIDGHFHSYKLTESSDENYWSVNHPEELIIACNLILHTHKQNLEKTLTIKAILDERLLGFEKDQINEGLSDDPDTFVMGG